MRFLTRAARSSQWAMKYRLCMSTVSLLICAGVSIGCSVTSVPSEQAESPSAVKRYVTRSFVMELISAEVLDDGVTLTFLYTNRWNRPHSAGAHLQQTFLVDNRGYRYQLKAGSELREFAPKIQEQIRLTFETVRPDASWVSLFSHWRVGSGEEDARVEMRRIALPHKSS